MEDTRVTFETAKLAKEKGFNERVHYFYKVKSENDIELYGCTRKQLVGLKGYVRIYHKVRDYHTNKEKLNAKLYRCSAPTQSVLQKWLREVHNIHFEIKPIFDVKDNLKPYHISVIKNPSGKDFEYEIVGSLDTYEEALEIGLQKALKLINIIK